jgi:tetratricopeptide (TPR) repeat protein
VIYGSKKEDIINMKMNKIMRNSLAYVLLGFIAVSACASKKNTAETNVEKKETPKVAEKTSIQDENPCENKWGTDESKTRQSIAYLQVHYKTDPKAAYPNWSYVIENAPCNRLSVYQMGDKMLRMLFKAETDSLTKQKYINDLNLNFGYRLKYFPGDTWSLKEKWAKTMYSYAPNEYEVINKNLNDIINKDKDSTDSDIMIYYLNNTFTAYNNGKVNKDVMFETYSKLSDIVETNIEVNEDDSAQYSRWKSIEASLNQIIDKVGTCEDLIKQYKPELPNRLTDASWLNKAEKAMRAKRCTKDPLYISILENLEKVDPSVNVYIRLSNYYYSNGSTTKGNQMLQKAINLEPGSSKNSDRYVKMASKALKAGNNSAARTYSDKALRLNSRNGYAILIKGNALYKMARASCSGFDKKAAAWIMMDYALKAKAADGRVAGQASRTYNRYAAYKPGQDDTFMQGLKKGQSYTIKCVGVNVTVR